MPAPDCHEKMGKDSTLSSFSERQIEPYKKSVSYNNKARCHTFGSPESGRCCASILLTISALLAGPEMSEQLDLAFKAQLLPDAIPTIFQHNEISRKRMKDLSDRRVSLAKRLQHKQVSVSAMYCYCVYKMHFSLLVDNITIYIYQRLYISIKQ